MASGFYISPGASGVGTKSPCVLASYLWEDRIAQSSLSSIFFNLKKSRRRITQFMPEKRRKESLKTFKNSLLLQGSGEFNLRAVSSKEAS